MSAARCVLLVALGKAHQHFSRGKFLSAFEGRQCLPGSGAIRAFQVLHPSEQLRDTCMLLVALRKRTCNSAG